MANKPPAFQFYADDWLSSPEIMLMTPAEEGAYIRLLAISWTKGGIPDDDEQLAVLSRLGEGWFNGSSTKIRAQFVKRRTKLVNVKQETVRQNQRKWREKSRQGGVASGKARKQKALREEIGSTTLQPPLEPKGNTPTPTPTPLIGIEKKSLKDVGLELEKEIKVQALWFTDELALKFHSISKDEATTFARIAEHLSEGIRSGLLIGIFESVLGWADEAISTGVGNPKGLFVKKVQQETGFSGRGMVLRK